MFQPDNYHSYGKIPVLSNELVYSNADAYYGTHYGLNENNAVHCINDSNGMYHISQSFMEGIYSNNEIKSLKFDPHEELLWCISSSGHLCAYYEFNLTKVVSVEVPELNKKINDDIYLLLDILISQKSAERLIYILGKEEVLIYKKTGLLHERIKFDYDLNCFAHHPYKLSSVVLGHDSGLSELDLERKKSINELKCPNFSLTSLLKYNRGLLAGTDNGQILTIDLRDRYSIQHSFKPHSNSLSDFTVNAEGYAVVSCGTYQYNQQFYTDKFLKVYDLRYKKPQCPIKVEMQPSFVRFMPVFNDSILLAAASGQYQIANFGQNLLGPPTEEALLLNEYDIIKAVDISSNSKLIAFGTSSGLISLTSNSYEDLKINNCSSETIFPVVPSYMSMDSVSYDDPKFIISSSEFATEPLDKEKFNKLSSDWPEQLCSKKYKYYRHLNIKFLLSRNNCKIS